MTLGQKILTRMAQFGIKNRVELADKISRGGSSVHANTVGKWTLEEAKPRGENLIALARALEIKAELLVLEDGQNPEKSDDEIRKIIREVVTAELKTLLERGTPIPPADSNLSGFFSSKKVPEEDKKGILRQIRNLLKMYAEDKAPGGGRNK